MPPHLLSKWHSASELSFWRPPWAQTFHLPSNITHANEKCTVSGFPSPFVTAVLASLDSTSALPWLCAKTPWCRCDKALIQWANDEAPTRLRAPTLSSGRCSYMDIVLKKFLNQRICFFTALSGCNLYCRTEGMSNWKQNLQWWVTAQEIMLCLLNQEK